tara:strand:+ start:1727 stop:2251 length:525 start_codon:yes stop_codon:yes gene_type:complete
MPWVNPALFGGSGGSFDTLFEIKVNTGTGSSSGTFFSTGGNTFSEKGDPNNNFASQNVSTNADSVEVNNLGNYLITVVSNTLIPTIVSGTITQLDLRYDVFDSNQQQFQSGSGSSVLRLMTNNVAESITAPTTFNFTDIASGVPFGENHMNIQFSATSPRPGVDGRVLLGFLKL